MTATKRAARVRWAIIRFPEGLCTVRVFQLNVASPFIRKGKPFALQRAGEAGWGGEVGQSRGRIKSCNAKASVSIHRECRKDTGTEATPLKAK